MNPYTLPGTAIARTPQHIAQVIADYYSIEARLIYACKLRKHKYLHPRQLVQAVLVFEGYSANEIAKLFKITRASVYSNCSKIVIRMKLYASNKGEYTEALTGLNIDAEHFYNELIKHKWIQRRLN